ncbi:ChrR Cupin-like domain-containing protein [Collimonas sp. OK607]|uniref:2,4'-dihydroxyacetophenone dioxygenase family protein n=1 Tax=Collimonas sp. OK607 TaxID=1798194 RepID=UPI0008E1580E|nr:2,4'-dihydroxyacetophenone dioxygenase family protein [Collimonas sp. OK607]SFB01183.1 ChrR Cupin-like domain-containing protein [Collimonas sp. OK607]
MNDSTPQDSYATYIRCDDDPWLLLDSTSGAEIKLCRLTPSTGEIVCLIRVPAGQTLAKHYHAGTVVVYTIDGTWSYNEGWNASPGDVVYEPAGSTHAPTMTGTGPTTIFAIIQGGFEFVDEQDQITARCTWKNLNDIYVDHCQKNDLKMRDLTA